ncbi:putative pectin lyase [Fadolivirus algeromassiliense]|jgi:hypothetical protein|uniref:Pectin lyase n=1 Tax=Fadolivirus FV1/VV64 TaxID=3070911 RepID=A0A7D3V959_9VIRU|nr:putative pectin lyase [Fadolivirus algeromassiliense]QKF94657.1 putative pectin lyase [Fadolivirus FV1/VV64]
MSEYYFCHKIVVLPYNSTDVDSRNEIDKFDIEFSDKMKEIYGIKETILLKKNEFIEDKQLFFNSKLLISQNSLSDTLKNLTNSKVLVIFVPGEYNLENENIVVDSLKFISVSDTEENLPKINISGNITIQCRYFSAKGVGFICNKKQDDYFSKEHLTYAGIIFTKKSEYILFSHCNLETQYNVDLEALSYCGRIKIFDVKSGAEKVNIDNCSFNGCNFELQSVNAATLNNNILKSTTICLRYTNSILYENKFSGLFRINMFNAHLTQINDNIFDSFFDPYYCIDADHNSNLYFNNNKIKTTYDKFNEFTIIKVYRYSKCYVKHNNVTIKPTQMLASVEFGGEIYISDNMFNKNKVEVACHDGNVCIGKNNICDEFSNDENVFKEVEFVLSERDIIKPDRKYISFQ